MIPFTFNDIEVGARLVVALARQAASLRGMPITYGDLLTLARSLYPKDEVLGRAVQVGIGPKLQFVESFCAVHGYPNLACLAVNRETSRPAPGYQGDWEADNRAVAAFDWRAADAQLAAYVAAMRAKVPPRFKPRKERPADVAWYAYFCSHRAACEKLTAEDKQEIINQMMAGLDPEAALARVLAAKQDFGSAS
ncbi:hypothetical protein [Pseudoduganella umbonata]|uniref:Uncharacterized protein n=1 Tax=Pseudoduganella umbonata TaxID=864828 RepID=A0A4P8HQ56_9BURK|nr:hypothetical protein [Pseudoduganella umbonata]MBB3221305.1 hypothetical protein [Pseudoduganella umbonata]QCP10475.1 hypothetical protein FCL38_08570 [Pseudoduganella umbonata]